MATAPKQDVLGEFSDLILPDKRLVDRVLKFVAAASMAPAESFPDMLEDVASLEAAYRFLNNKRVTFEALQAPHKARVVEQGRQTASVVLAHDTSDVQTPWADADAVGYLNTGEAGYRIHVSLALSIESDRPV